jgi:enoyl-CoA hydratase/carnithine racemase
MCCYMLCCCEHNGFRQILDSRYMQQHTSCNAAVVLSLVLLQEAFSVLEQCRFPVIAAVQGAGGMNSSLTCMHSSGKCTQMLTCTTAASPMHTAHIANASTHCCGLSGSPAQQLQQLTCTVQNLDAAPLLSAAGACVGAGVDLITAADLRYCSQDAYFSVKVGALELAVAAAAAAAAAGYATAGEQTTSRCRMRQHILPGCATPPSPIFHCNSTDTTNTFIMSTFSVMMRHTAAAARLQEVDLAITADLGTLQRLPSIIGHGEGATAAVSCSGHGVAVGARARLPAQHACAHAHYTYAHCVCIAPVAASHCLLGRGFGVSWEAASGHVTACTRACMLCSACPPILCWSGSCTDLLHARHACCCGGLLLQVLLLSWR